MADDNNNKVGEQPSTPAEKPIKKVEIDPKTGKPKKKKKNYLNNKDMKAELVKCHEKGEMTPEFAKMIMLLAERYASRYEYNEYSGHIDDMKSAAVLNIVKVWKNFDLEKGDNPFAYFTQAVKFSFWQYTAIEKKHRLNRDELLIDIGELPSDTYLADFEKERTRLRDEHDLDSGNEDEIDDESE